MSHCDLERLDRALHFHYHSDCSALFAFGSLQKRTKQFLNIKRDGAPFYATWSLLIGMRGITTKKICDDETLLLLLKYENISLSSIVERKVSLNLTKKRSKNVASSTLIIRRETCCKQKS